MDQATRGGLLLFSLNKKKLLKKYKMHSGDEEKKAITNYFVKGARKNQEASQRELCEKQHVYWLLSTFLRFIFLLFFLLILSLASSVSYCLDS